MSFAELLTDKESKLLSELEREITHREHIEYEYHALMADYEALVQEYARLEEELAREAGY